MRLRRLGQSGASSPSGVEQIEVLEIATAAPAATPNRLDAFGLLSSRQARIYLRWPNFERRHVVDPRAGREIEDLRRLSGNSTGSLFSPILLLLDDGRIVPEASFETVLDQQADAAQATPIP
jgi:hypothetical protein